MLLKDHLTGRSADLKSRQTGAQAGAQAAEDQATPARVDRGVRFAAVMVEYYLWLPALLLYAVARKLPPGSKTWQTLARSAALLYGIVLVVYQVRSIKRNGATLGLSWFRLTVRDQAGAPFRCGSTCCCGTSSACPVGDFPPDSGERSPLPFARGPNSWGSPIGSSGNTSRIEAVHEGDRKSGEHVPDGMAL